MPKVRKLILPLNVEKFWSRIHIKGDHECWNWSGGAICRGYGTFWNGEKTERTHRIAYRLTKGPIPDGLCVLHSCDNRLCCNPNHLHIGTYADNNREKMERGRHVAPKGEMYGLSKLKESQVLAIRAKYNPEENSHSVLAKEYGVHKSLITLILNRKIWKHI